MQRHAPVPAPSKNVVTGEQICRDLDAVHNLPTGPVATALAFDIDACGTCAQIPHQPEHINNS